jgi:peptidoglycan glycosyltransferase
VLAAAGALPVVGVTTPLLSAGTSSGVAVLLAVGVIAGAGTAAPTPAPVPAAGRDHGAVDPSAPVVARVAGRRTVVPTLSAAVVVLAAGATLLHAQVVAADQRLRRYDPGGDVAWRTRPSMHRGRVLAADGTVLATTRWEGRGHRAYPLGSLTAEAVGYLTDALGAAGVEGEAAPVLECGTGELNLARRLLGRRCQPTDLRLTLDLRIQRAAAAALGDRHGAVVALDPRSGAVLAVLSSPSFDPNAVVYPPDRRVAFRRALAAKRRYDGNDAAHAGTGGTYGTGPGLHGLATGLRFNPGSTFKLVTAAALAPSGSGFTAPATATLAYHGGRQRLSNARGAACGGSLVEAIRVSCNTAIALVAREAGGGALARTAQALGFDGRPRRVAGVPIVASTAPGAGDLYPRGPCDLELAAIGQQCVQATTFQMATVAASIAAGGLRRDPIWWRRPNGAGSSCRGTGRAAGSGSCRPRPRTC